MRTIAEMAAVNGGHRLRKGITAMSKDTEQAERDSRLERGQLDPFRTPAAMREDLEPEDDDLWLETLP